MKSKKPQPFFVFNSDAGASGGGDAGGAGAKGYEPPSSVDSLESLPAALRGFYEASEDGSTFKLADVSGLRKNRDKALRQFKTLADNLEKAKGKGFDLEKILTLEDALDLDELLAAKAEAANGDGKKKKADVPDELARKWEEDKKKALEKERKLTEAEAAKVLALAAELRSLKLDTKVRAAASKAGVAEDELDDVLILTQPRFDLEEVEGPDGKKVARIVVKDKDGDVMPGMTLEKFWSETYKEEKPRVYKGNPNGGSGASAHNKAGGGGADLANASPERLLEIGYAQGRRST